MTKKLILVFIILLGFLLRGWEFGNIPAGIYVDEASHGVNAYSILTTGKDEYGKDFPIFLRSFGTYAASLYSYLTIIPVSIIGLNEISVRLVSLISGIILIALASFQFGLIVGLIIAISPVFVFVSRAAFESNLALTILILGSVLALKSEKYPRLLILAFPVLTLSSYAYHAERLLSLILIMFFSFKYWRLLDRKLILLAALFGLLILAPIFSISFKEGAYARLSGLTVEGTFSEKIFNTSRLYLAYLSPNNLFSKPDPDPQRSFPDLSVFYWWMFIPLIFGIYQFTKNKDWKNITGQYFLLILFSTPILAAFTKDYFSTIRVLPIFIAYSWLIAKGLNPVVRYKFILTFLISISLFELYSNLILLRFEKSSVWNYEYKQLFQVLNGYQNQNIVIENPKPIYILNAFYNKTDPRILYSRFNDSQRNDYYSKVEFEENFRLKNIEYRSIHWREDVYKDQILVADTLAISETQAKEHKLNLIHEIKDTAGKITLRIFKTDPKQKCLNYDVQIPDIKEKCSGFER